MLVLVLDPFFAALLDGREDVLDVDPAQSIVPGTGVPAVLRNSTNAPRGTPDTFSAALSVVGLSRATSGAFPRSTAWEARCFLGESFDRRLAIPPGVRGAAEREAPRRRTTGRNSSLVGWQQPWTCT
ncbi:MAG TPA: hypothetical protein VGL61_31555 [Kofleriaceae bacterium]